MLKGRRRDYLQNRELTRGFVKERLTHFNQIYNFTFGKVSIKNQKSRWGSCSSKGNLNFNYQIIKLPPECADYIIVHEICHLKEFNHSKKFWELVAKTIPNYKEIKNELKTLIVL